MQKKSMPVNALVMGTVCCIQKSSSYVGYSMNFLVGVYMIKLLCYILYIIEIKQYVAKSVSFFVGTVSSC